MVKKTGVKDLDKVEGDLAVDFAGSLAESLVDSKILKADYVSYNEDELPPTEYVSTGVRALDEKLGGGIAVGKIGEIFGLNASGKSTLVYHIAKQFQEAGATILAIDTEFSWDQDRFEQIGGRRDRVVRAQADTVEEIYDIILAAMKKQLYAGAKAPLLLITVDTIAQASTKKELAARLAGEDYYDVGRKAGLLSSYMRTLVRQIGGQRIALVFINQVRQSMKMVGPYSSPDDIWTVPGGEAVKFAASWRVRVQAGKKLKNGSGEDSEVIGQAVKFVTVKCKFAPPWQRVEADLIYESGQFEQTAGLLLALKNGKPPHLKRTKKGGGGYLASEVLQAQFGFPAEIDEASLKELLTSKYAELSAFAFGTDEDSESASAPAEEANAG